MTTDQQTAQQRHQTALGRIDRQTTTLASQVLVAHQAGHPDRDTHAAALIVLQGRRRILERHAPHPDTPHWCTYGSWGDSWPHSWPCPDWTDAACENQP